MRPSRWQRGRGRLAQWWGLPHGARLDTGRRQAEEGGWIFAREQVVGRVHGEPHLTLASKDEKKCFSPSVCLYPILRAWKEGRHGEGPEAQGQCGQHQPDAEPSAAHPVTYPGSRAAVSSGQEGRVWTASPGPRSSVGPSPAAGPGKGPWVRTS